MAAHISSTPIPLATTLPPFYFRLDMRYTEEILRSWDPSHSSDNSWIALAQKIAWIIQIPFLLIAISEGTLKNGLLLLLNGALFTLYSLHSLYQHVTHRLFP